MEKEINEFMIYEAGKIMNIKLMDFEKRYTEVNNKFEILDIEKEIKEFMVSEEGKMLPEEEMDFLDDILIKVMTKKEYFHSGLDPCRFKH